MGIITISKEFGSGGREIAEAVASKLDLDYFDREIVKAVAFKTGVPEMEAEEFDEDKYNSMKVFFSRVLDPVIANKRYKELFSLMPSKKVTGAKKRFKPYTCEINGWLDSDIFKEIIESFILKLAEKNRAVIVGRGSQYILKEHPSVLHVRIVAPSEYKVERSLKYKGIDPENAKRIIEEIDRRRKRYIKHYYNEDWGNPYAYHLVINSGKINLPSAVDVITTAYAKLEKKKK